MIIDAAGERSEQGRFLSKGPVSSNAGLDAVPRAPSVASLWGHSLGHKSGVISVVEIQASFKHSSFQESPASTAARVTVVEPLPGKLNAKAIRRCGHAVVDPTADRDHPERPKEVVFKAEMRRAIEIKDVATPQLCAGNPPRAYDTRRIV